MADQPVTSGHGHLDFGKHEDVVFNKAPLTTVLCQVRFSQILALLDQSGVAGLQEALRGEYPKTGSDIDMEIAIEGSQTQFRRKAPVWRMRTDDDVWTISAAIDFVSLETSRYPHFDEFRKRLDFLLSATDRTLKPGRSTRVGLRKINMLRKDDVDRYPEWMRYLRPELLGIASADSLPGVVVGSYCETSISDGEDGTLTVRFGMDKEESRSFRLDLDYWTKKSLEIRGDGALSAAVAAYSDSATSFFHWAITPEMYRYLDPRPRAGGSHGDT